MSLKVGSLIELCKYLETAKRHIFGNHRIEFGPLFSTILPLSRPDRVANRFLFSHKSKIELEDSEKLYFSAKEKKL